MANAYPDLLSQTSDEKNIAGQLRQAALVIAIAGGVFALMLFVTRTIPSARLDSTAGSTSNVERKIGEFKEGVEAAPGVVVVVDMTVYADVAGEMDQELARIIELRQPQIRSAVSETLRKVSYTDLFEPTLTTLKRKMKVAMVQASGEETHVFDQLIIPSYDVRRVN